MAGSALVGRVAARSFHYPGHHRDVVIWNQIRIIMETGGNMHYIPILSTLVTFAFAVAVFRRYLLRRGPHC